MSCEDCIGPNDCNKYQSLRHAAKEGRSYLDVVQDTVSCRRGWGCNQAQNYDVPYRGE
jgi:hypothetical protein